MTIKLINSFLIATFYPFGLVSAFFTGSIHNLTIFSEIITAIVFTPAIIAVLLYVINHLIGYRLDPLSLAIYIAIPINFALLYFVTFKEQRAY